MTHVFAQCLTSPGAGAGTGLCRVHRPVVVQTGRDIAGGKQEPAGTGSGSDRTGQDLTRAELRPLAQAEYQFRQLWHFLFPGPSQVQRQSRQCWNTNR